MPSLTRTHSRSRTRERAVSAPGRAVVLVVGCLLIVAACSSSSSDTASGGTGSSSEVGACPVDPVRVVVSVDQWGDIVDALAGACGEVTTVVSGTTGDPHDYEPSPADNAAFARADLVVVNGLGYDQWATDAVDASSRAPAVVDAGAVMGLSDGANPHLWYDPDAVDAVAAAVTTSLTDAAPGASSYFATQATAWDASMQPYRDEIAAIRAEHSDATYAASETVFAYMATALGLVDVTPSGFATASANESEPAPGDLHELEAVLERGDADVFVYNTQTEGALTAQLRDRAVDADVPVVDVTETVPPGVTSFVDWQVGQLRSLAAALAR